MLFRSVYLIKSSRIGFSQGLLQYTTKATKRPNVWVVTDGGIESTLQAVTVGKRLGEFNVKTIQSSQFIRVLPMVLQKYIVDWGTKRNMTTTKSLPWYLSGDSTEAGPPPDYVVCSGNNAVPGALQVAQSYPPKQVFSVFLGFTNLPFIHFDQVVIPKYEANVKMAKLGPLVIQKNCIVTEVPLLDTALLPLTGKSKQLCDDLLHAFSTKEKKDTTVVVIGGHTSQCRWYSEDAVNLVHNMKKMVTHLGSNLLVIFTEKTPLSIKQTITNTISKSIPEHDTKVVTWDTTQEGLTSLERIEAYDNLIHKASRVVVTADLDYATAHATMKRKPVYVTFGGQCRGHLLQFQRWLRDQRLTRKLRLDRKHKPSHHPKQQPLVDPYSYLGHHPSFAVAAKVFAPATMDHVIHELETIRQEKITGKRRQD
ncbi:hypothetical protein [Absidia glauca]|uniref:Mitochondrial fission protein ELM1 n=1 Tax=Absidia glauca TaxID=4829 RepID=A0A168QAL6_ABSGL|nr:hypothetical protein [Absidia glauca]